MNVERAVVGGLLGTQKGRQVEIMNTFELVIDRPSPPLPPTTGGPDQLSEEEGRKGMKEGAGGEWKVDREYFDTRKEQCTSPPPSSLPFCVGRAVVGMS